MKQRYKILLAIGLFLSMRPLIAITDGPGVVVTMVVLSGLYGIYELFRKGYMSAVSIVLFLLVGWWFLLILVCFGPLTLLLASILPEKKTAKALERGGGEL